MLQQQNNDGIGREAPEASAQSPFPKTFLTKAAISARLLGKEIYRKKLKWIDLRRADYRLGQKAYDQHSTLPAQSKIVDRLQRIEGGIEALSVTSKSGPSFKDKSVAAVKQMGKAMKIRFLKSRRNHLLRKLGCQIRQGEDQSANAFRAELDESKATAAKITELNSDISDLAAKTFFWARRPLLLSAILAAVVLWAGIVHQQAQTADLSTPKKAVEAFEAALEKDNMKLASSLALGDEAQLTVTKMYYERIRAYLRVETARKTKFDSPEDGAKNWQQYLDRWKAAPEAIAGDTATVGEPSESTGWRMIWGGYKLRQIEGRWYVDLSASNPDDFRSKKSFADEAATKQMLKDVDEIIRGIEQGRYKDDQEVISAWNGLVETAKQGNTTSAVSGGALQTKPTRASAELANKPSKGSHGLLGWLPQSGGTTRDAETWANSYRKAKFISRSEFVKNAGPVHLVIRQGSGVSECVHNLEDLVRTAASQHGLTIASGPTDVELVVDADVDRSKITTSEFTNFGEVQQEGYFMVVNVYVQVGFRMKVNCRRGDKFVQLNAYPYRNWNEYSGCMGDLASFETEYPKAFRYALDGAFDGVAKLTEADDPTDDAAWGASLWPASRDAELYKNFQSPITGESGGSDHAFYGVTKFDTSMAFLNEAQKDFQTSALQQSWTSELNRNGHELDSSSDVRIQDDFNASLVKCGALGGTPCYADLSGIRVWQKNVVFPFNGELRRGRVCIWSDCESAIALPREYGNTARDLMNRSIRSAAKEFALRR